MEKIFKVTCTMCGEINELSLKDIRGFETYECAKCGAEEYTPEMGEYIDVPMYSEEDGEYLGTKREYI